MTVARPTQTDRRQKWTTLGLHVVYNWSTFFYTMLRGAAWPSSCRQGLSGDMASTPGRQRRPCLHGWGRGDGGVRIGLWNPAVFLLHDNATHDGKGANQQVGEAMKKEKIHPKDCGERPDWLPCLEHRGTPSFPGCGRREGPSWPKRRCLTPTRATHGERHTQKNKNGQM